MTYLRNTLCALALVLYGCSDDDVATEPAVDGGSSQQDAAPVSPTSDAGSVSNAVPLVDWIDDLIDHHTDDKSAPDTVHDKNIIDNKSPATFAKRFPR